ncbi:MAG: AarF/ABC1/UbiB kinase family protein [Alphaproteobacteria bacterium]|nr:AarF/ABC1/UbiB kinase family protein [Alphaproteobacteria bacterium]
MTVEDNSLSERIKRYAKVSTSLTGFATKIAGHYYLGRDMNSLTYAQELKAVLGELKGPIMKVAQMLSTIPDFLPSEYMAELAQLQAQAPPMGWHFVKRRMMAELGPDWLTKFASFEQSASASASLGQVHKAIDHQGNVLACKLQYPDMTSIVEADLQQLRILLKLYDAYDKAIQSDEIFNEISARLREELDYQREGQHIQMFSHMLESVPGVHIPQYISFLSTTRLLTMSWLEGQPLMQTQEHSLGQRNQIARHMFRTWYTPFYHYGIIHGDPHLGNYTVREDQSVNLLDFGCVRVFPISFVEGVLDLYHALLHNDKDLAVHAYKSWGFTNISQELMEILDIWARFLYGPLMEDRVRPIEENHSGVYGKEVAAKVHAELRRIGGVKPPREFVFMDRAAIGLGSVFMHLRAELNWYQEFHTLIENVNAQALLQNREKLFQGIEVEENS